MTDTTVNHPASADERDQSESDERPGLGPIATTAVAIGVTVAVGGTAFMIAGLLAAAGSAASGGCGGA
jgi:hypothetical protein